MIASYPELTLSDGNQAYCLRRSEAKFVDEEIPKYFGHGIEVGPGATVFDVGANIGLFTLSVHRRCGGDVDLFAFEPAPPVYDVLKANVGRTGSSRLHAIPCGVSSAAGEIELSYFPRLTLWSSMCRDESNRLEERDRIRACFLAGVKDGSMFPWLRPAPLRLQSFVINRILRYLMKMKKCRCQLVTVSEIIDQHDVQRIDLLKVDVEGQEHEVLKGIRSEHWPMIQQVVLEVEQYSRMGEPAMDTLRGHGFADVGTDRDTLDVSGDTAIVFARR